MSDRLAILFSGEIAAMGTPRDLYHQPPTESVGEFLGDMNVLECPITQNKNEGESLFTLLGVDLENRSTSSEGSVRVGIRPESFAPSGVHQHQVNGILEDAQFEGEIWRMTVKASDQSIRVSLSPNFRIEPPQVGKEWAFSFAEESVVLF